MKLVSSGAFIALCAMLSILPTKSLASDFKIVFPIKDVPQYQARISAVFDYSGKHNCAVRGGCDDIVEAFDSQEIVNCAVNGGKYDI